MTETEEFMFMVNELEQLMVQQFRGLQNLVEVTRAERQALNQRSVETLMESTEAKEAQLDQLSLFEDRFRMIIHTLAMSQDLEITDESNLNMILPYLPEDGAERLSRLADGILTLVRQARDLNLGNQILVQNQLDWVQACRAFLFEGLQTLDIYSHPAAPAKRLAVSGMDYRA